jgi:hypothetical protein
MPCTAASAGGVRNTSTKREPEWLILNFVATWQRRGRFSPAQPIAQNFAAAASAEEGLSV